MSHFKSVNTSKISFGKDKGKLSVKFEVVMTEEDFDYLFKEQYKEQLTKQAVKLNGIS